MITIYDIAEKTGYTAPTVSKAINGTGYLNARTREKILKTAEEMGYQPNMVARTLTTKKSNLIGVIYDDCKMKQGFDHPLFGGMLNRFRAQVEDAGYDIIFLSRQFRMSYVAHSRYRSVDGVAIINPDDNGADQLVAIHEAGIPCISTNNYIPGICTVVTENEKSGYAGAEYLISMGHRKIAFLAGPVNNFSPAAQERYTGFCKCLNDHGIVFDKRLFQECNFWHSKAGYEGFARIYRRTTDFTAVFATDDLLAFGVMEYAEEHNIRIPDRLSLIGFDNDRVASFCHPRLTTFSQDKVLIADLAAETLLQLMVGIPAPEIIRVPATLIMRESVKKIL
ncbi:MAG: LacI family DNA-binding transcriptional regulator [Treponema sp.]